MIAAALALIDICGSALSWLIATNIGRWILQGLLFFGITFVTSKITTGAVTPALASMFDGMGADVVSWVAYLQVDKAITIILSAYASVAALHWTISRAPSRVGA